MNTIVEKTDTELKADVLAELKYEPGVDITDIGVLVKDGAVTLNGYATSYGEKSNAVSATEGFHRKFKLIQRRAYGFRSFTNYRLRVIAQCG